VIPSTASQSLFAEASADEASLDVHARRTLRGIYGLLVPAILVLVVLARPLLSIFGTAYAENGTRCLQLLALSGFFAGFSYVADTILNARKRVAGFVLVNVLGTICAVGFPIALLSHGLTGIGFGWLLGQIGYFAVAAAALMWDRPVVSRPRPGRREPTWS
jgi:O-antigen/teichoic acid export membrane protein